MLKHIGLFEAKTRLSAIVVAAEKGETTILTRKGNPVAEISPIRAEREDVQDAADGLRRLARELWAEHGPVSTSEVRAMMNEGRRLK